MEDAELTLDLGGDDTYRNNAGGSRNRTDERFAAAAAIDLGEGSDVYETTVDDKDGVQGGTALGVGLLLDEGGDDAYRVQRSEGTPSTANGFFQGSGASGAGLLLDLGGDDTYTSLGLAQGASVIGIGLLLDSAGTDHYHVRPTIDSEGAQGVGCAGAAALVDRGPSSDRYNATVTDLQGMGCVGGLGVLFDEAGSDTYLVSHGRGYLSGALDEEESGWPSGMSGWSQGYGELGGTGILVDGGGNDTYRVEEGTGFDGDQSQGVGLLGGVGILRDQAGRDAYRAVISSQGVGAAGTGVLADGSGDDTYAVSANAAQGVGSLGGTGALVDSDGHDRYVVPPEEDYGFNRFCQGYGSSGVGLLFDTGGDDDEYHCPDGRTSEGQRADDGVWTSGELGIGIDR